MRLEKPMEPDFMPGRMVHSTEVNFSMEIFMGVVGFKMRRFDPALARQRAAITPGQAELGPDGMLVAELRGVVVVILEFKKHR